MGLLFVGGVMNLLWIAAIAAFILLEKTVPFGHTAGTSCRRCDDPGWSGESHRIGCNHLSSREQGEQLPPVERFHSFP